MKVNSEGEPMDHRFDALRYMLGSGAICLTDSMARDAEFLRKLEVESLVQSKLCRMQRYLDRHRAELRFRGRNPERMLEKYKRFLVWMYKVEI